jgi:hypothetical protein
MNNLSCVQWLAIGKEDLFESCFEGLGANRIFCFYFYFIPICTAAPEYFFCFNEDRLHYIQSM